jgi:hypothetical protein
MTNQHQQFIKTHFFANGFYSSALARWCKEDFSWLSQYEGDTISEKSWNVFYRRPICICGNKTSFIDFRSGYRKSCSLKCGQLQLMNQKSGRQSNLWNDQVWRDQTSKRMKETHFKNRSKKKLEELKGKDILPLDEITPGFDNVYRWQHRCGEIFTKSFKRTFSIYCPKCHVSKGQGQLYEFIRKHFNGEIIVNDRSAIAPKEIDIYLPALKLGFEFNGKYWHRGDGFREAVKVFEGEEAGIKIVNVWEIDWISKRQDEESRILAAIS